MTDFLPVLRSSLSVSFHLVLHNKSFICHRRYMGTSQILMWCHSDVSWRDVGTTWHPLPGLPDGVSRAARAWSAARVDGVTLLDCPSGFLRHINTWVVNTLLKYKLVLARNKDFIFRQGLTLCNTLGLRVCKQMISCRYGRQMSVVVVKQS
jgi:hypothetical protein